MRIEPLPPGRSRIREQYIHMIRRLFDLLHQPLDFSDLRTVCRDGDGLCAWALVGKGVEGGAGLIAGGGFAGGDVDFGAAGLEEAVQIPFSVGSVRREGRQDTPKQRGGPDPANRLLRGRLCLRGRIYSGSLGAWSELLLLLP